MKVQNYKTAVIRWTDDMRYVPSLRMYVSKDEVVEIPRLIAENLIVQGFAVKCKAARAENVELSAFAPGSSNI